MLIIFPDIGMKKIDRYDWSDYSDLTQSYNWSLVPLMDKIYGSTTKGMSASIYPSHNRKSYPCQSYVHREVHNQTNHQSDAIHEMDGVDFDVSSLSDRFI